MSKQLSTQAIADIYLRWLYKIESKSKKNSKELFSVSTLDRCLDEKKVYYNQQILDNVFSLLKKKGFIEINEKRGGSILFYEPRVDPFDIDVDNIKVQVLEYKLTSTGKDFVLHNQKLDLEAIKTKKQNTEKWKDRVWGFIAAVILSVIGLLLKFMISHS